MQNEGPEVGGRSPKDREKLLGGFTLPHCVCHHARTGVLGACGSSAHVHGQPRCRQFRVEGLGVEGWGFRV